MDTNGNYIQNQFCNYEVALKLKELSFNEKCLAMFNLEHNLRFIKNKTGYPNGSRNSECEPNVLAPLWQQAIDWCEEKSGLNIYIAYCEYASEEENGWRYTFTNPTKPQYWKGNYESKQEAREEAILKAIELINDK